MMHTELNLTLQNFVRVSVKWYDIKHVCNEENVLNRGQHIKVHKKPSSYNYVLKCIFLNENWHMFIHISLKYIS